MLEQSLISQIVSGLATYMSQSGKSANATALELGISAATLSSIMNGKHQAISDEMWRKIQSFLRLDAWQIMETPNFRAIQNLCKDAKENARFVSISDFTGAGKTTALRHYQRNNANVYYVLGNAYMSQNDLIEAIMRAVGVNASGNKLQKILAICGRLNSQQAPLLVIDDFGKLNDGCYRLLQLLYDETERNCGIVISGTEYLKNYIAKAANKDKMGFRELRRRISYIQSLNLPSKEEIKQFCSVHGIKDMEFIKNLYTSVTDYGTLRTYIENEQRRVQRKGTTQNAN